MSKLRFHISMSLDGYVAGRDQGRDDPLGEGGLNLHDWFARTRMFKTMFGEPEEGETGVDNDRADEWREDFGATIMGRNMFGPIRGDWGDADWRGWWGHNPPYHSPVFVLTHHAHAPIEMEGGTTFHFVTDGPEAALEQARRVARARDINIGGGASTAQQYATSLLGIGAGMALNPVLLAATGEVEQSDAGLASGIVNTSFMMGGALGLAVLASVASSRTEALITAGETHAGALVGGYHAAFVVGAGFAALAALLTARLMREPSAVSLMPKPSAPRRPTASRACGPALISSSPTPRRVTSRRPTCQVAHKRRLRVSRGPTGLVAALTGASRGARRATLPAPPSLLITTVLDRPRSWCRVSRPLHKSGGDQRHRASRAARPFRQRRRRPPVERRTSAVEHREIELAQPVAVGEDVHRDDPPVPDRYAAHQVRLPVAHDDHSGHAVDERRPPGNRAHSPQVPASLGHPSSDSFSRGGRPPLQRHLAL
jgi:dihydrofolate reductase